MSAIAVASGITLLAPALGGRPGSVCFALGIAALPPAFLALATAGRPDRAASAAVVGLWGALSVGLLGVVHWPWIPGEGGGAAVAAALVWILGVLCALPLVIVATAFARWHRPDPATREDA